MHPIGWDALGLPAENAAIKRGIHPEKWTRQNIASMKRQLQRLGFSYPWSREIATCDASYYRWNQWIFLRMLERGIAYRAKAPVNWCPSCLTVLANEQAEGGICWRCKNPVEQRDMEQWFLRITAYQDQLLDDMAQLAAWPERVLVQQKNWIGKSHGAEVDFPVEGAEPIRVFTTRIDTICGATFMVLAPEHPMVDGLLAGQEDAATRKAQIARLRAQDRRARLEGQVEKEGVFTGALRHEPVHEREDPGLGRQLRADGLRHRRDHVRPRPRPARLRVRPQVRPRGARRHPARGRAPRRRHDAGRVRRRRPRRQQRALRRHDGRRGHPEDGRLGASRRASARPRPPTASRTGSSAGSATGARRSRSSTARRTACSRCPTTSCRSSLPPDAPFTGEGGNPLEKVPAFVKRHLPEVRRGRPGARRTPWTPSWTRPGTSTATSRRRRTTDRSTRPP